MRGMPELPDGSSGSKTSPCAMRLQSKLPCNERGLNPPLTYRAALLDPPTARAATCYKRCLERKAGIQASLN
jgi:hypothetical protein